MAKRAKIGVLVRAKPKKRGIHKKSLNKDEKRHQNKSRYK